jgi:enterochelin esterase-like enzyme
VQLTRRVVLGAGVGLGVAAMGGWAADTASPAAVHRLFGGCRGADAPRAAATVTRGLLSSRAMRGDVRWSIARPANSGSGPLPVVVAFHPRGGSADEVIAMGWHEFVADAVARGAARPFAVAAVDGGTAAYWHRRASGIDPMTMVLDEFVPWLAKQGLGGSVTSTVAAGWSMGGYGALLAAETAPDVFGAVVATSPAFWWSYAEAVGGHPDTFDSEADWAGHDVGAHAALLASRPVRLDCGDLDPLAPGVRRLLAVLPRAEGGISPGCHSDGFWRAVAPTQVAFVDRFFSAAPSAARGVS